MKHILAFLCLCSPLAAEITGPRTVGLGELVELKTDQPGAWLPLQPVDLRTMRGESGSLGFSSGLKEGSIVIAQIVDEGNGRWRAERWIIAVKKGMM